MPTCDQLDGLRAGYADGTLDAAGLELLVGHLGECRACARDVAVQQQVRQALWTRREALEDTAPVALRRRLEATLRPPSAVVPFVAPSRARTRATTWLGRLVPMPVAAALVLAVAGVIVAGALAPRGAVLATQLALDHFKCRLIASVSPDARPEPLERAWEQRFGWAVDIPPSAPESGLTLVGLRNCLYHDGTMAHVLYDYRGRRLSLFVMPRAEAAGGAVGVLGQRTVAWQAGGRTYALVTDRDAGDLGVIEQYVRQAAH